ncbi:helix-turn-helix domain-containing protein [Nocardioides plantarum]|uniref:Helix-turn-helix domain-containing protein n=1 Tax=Nocardioides plantarum TaxID=29299 RepID=A0ABV5KIA2_9ACTN|nr:helix-turn-helix transcriptional regulator [Nocardioides plantarum]
MRSELWEAIAAVDPVLLGRRLKEARLEAGLTQPEAVGDGMSAAYLSRVERGQRRPSPAALEKLCDRLGVSMDLVVRGTDRTDPRAVECEVGFAELAALSGASHDALARATRLLESGELDGSTHLHGRILMVLGTAQAALGNPADAVETLTRVLASSPPTHLRAQASLRLSRLLREGGDLPRATSVAEDAIDVLDNDGGRSAQVADDTAHLKVTLAAACWESGDVERALLICRQVAAESEIGGSPAGRAAAYWNTAIIESEAGNLDEALTLTRKALHLFENETDLRLYARLRTQLGELLLRIDPPETDEAFEHLTAASQALGLTSADSYDVLHNTMALARASFARGDLERARRDAAACLDQADGHPYVAATAATLLSRIAGQESDRSAERDHLLAAVGYLAHAGADRRIAQLWFTLASSLDEVGLTEEAKDAYRRAAASTGLTATYSNAAKAQHI